MSKALAIVKSTALEILSEPLTLLVTLAALALAVLAPVFHYHQFGEPTRMARDAGLSSLLMSTLVLAVFSTIRSFRREIESGTMEMALAHPVSRVEFFLAKTLGAYLALAPVALALFAATLTMTIGAEAGAIVAEKMGGLITVLGPFVAGGVALIFVPMFLSALLNRFARFRFVLSSMVISSVLSALLIAADVAFAFSDPAIGSWTCRLLPMVALILVLDALLLCASAAFAVRLPANGAAAAGALVVAASLPFFGNFYPAEELAKGGSVSLSFLALVFAATLPACLAFLILGGFYVRRLDH